MATNFNLAARVSNLKITVNSVDDDDEDDVKRELMCPICLDYFKQPVILSCGHNFCQDCISLHWSRTGDRNHGYECPQCRMVFSNMTVTKNFVVQNLVERLDELSELRGSAPPPSCATKVIGDQCDHHGEELKMYCQTDRCPICVICRESRAHRNHEVFPVSEVVSDMEAVLESKLEELEWHRTQCEKVITTEERDKTEARNMKKKLREKIEADVGQLVQFLLEERDSMLDRLDADEEATIQAINNNLGLVEAQLAAVDKDIANIRSQLTGEISFENLTKAHDKIQHSKPMETPAVTDWPVAWPELSDPFQLIIWKKMMRAMPTRILNVTLDPDTAHPSLLITDDDTVAEETDVLLEEGVDLPQRFNRFPGVLANDSFSGGQHYWEVNVTGKCVWFLGVATEGSARKGFVSLRPSSGFWTMSQRLLSNQEQKKVRLFCNNDGGAAPLDKTWPLLRVGVLLDYDGGRVGFYNAANMEKLCDLDASFKGRLVYPFFSPGKKDHRGSFQICHYYY